MSSDVKAEILVNNYPLRIAKLRTMPGMLALARLTRISGPALAQLASGKTKAGFSLGDVDVSGLLAEMTQSISDDNLTWAVELIRSITEVRLTEHNKGWAPLTDGLFETVFSGNYTAVLEWIYKGMDHNFADFLDDVRQRLVVTLAVTTEKNGKPLDSQKE